MEGLLHWFGGIKSQLEKMHQEADQIVENIINDHKMGKTTLELGKNEKNHEDLVDVLLKVQEDGDGEFRLTTDNMKAVIWSLPRSDPNTCDLWLSLPPPTVIATVHEMASQTSLLNSQARAASPSPLQLPPATVTFSAADTVIAACREPPVPPAVSRASPTAPDSAPDASHVAPDSPAAASKPGPAASPPAATATHHMVTSVTSRAAFGKKCKDQEKYLSLLEDTLKLADGFHIADLFPSIEGFLQWITGIKSKLEKMHKEADQILENIINEHRRDKEATLMEHGKHEKNEDLVDVLLKVQENGDAGLRLTTDNIKAVIWDIIGAGSETSATTIDWAIDDCLVVVMTDEVILDFINELEKNFSGTVPLTWIWDRPITARHKCAT
ncbi:hypothetical protein LWI29_013493 [Acer saccharum]|uniref:Uncharacterized protein n=1 Tax=Acer saccharum TaxID=4024 RepID=A0AA39W391_ACESA|nr:hypothetical protein LWI29_013493 [Acer saccharum]